MGAARDRREFAFNVLASSATGAAVIVITNPLDCLKQRWQVAPTASAAHAASLRAFAADVCRSDGLLRGLWLPGLATNALACTVSVGTRLGFYPWLRGFFAGSDGRKHGGGMFLAGLSGGAAGYLMAAPLFHASRVAQCGAQLAGAPGPDAGFRALGALRRRGVAGLWLGAHVLVARGCLMSATQLAAYDASKTAALRAGLLEDGPALHCGCSFLASILCTTAICPLDCLLTRYQGARHRAFPSPLACGRAMVGEEGLAVFFRGWLPLWGRFLPSSVLTFYIYEQLRRSVLGAYLD